MPVKLPDFDSSDVNSIISSAESLVGYSLRDFFPDGVGGSGVSVKGGFGRVLEKCFGLENNNDSRPDFIDAGLELKSSPVKFLKSGRLSAKERLVLNIINYDTIVDETWESSHFLSKNELILLVLYLYEPDKDFLNFLIKFVHLLKLEGVDREIVRQDWHTIVNKVRNGLAHELSEGDTNYLGACRKGWKERPVQYQSGVIPAKKRAFSFKQKYMTAVLRRIENVEPLIKNPAILREKSFEEVVVERLSPFKNKTTQEIEQVLGISLNKKAKGYYASLAKRMLGVSAKHVEEFEKADVTIKSIRLKPSGMPKESMSFKAFKFTDVATQDWEESEFLEQIEKRFFFVIYQITPQQDVIFKKAFFWTMSYQDREEAKKVWLQTKKVINKGIQTKQEGKRVTNNLPGVKENSVAHVRPHAQKKKDTHPLPQGGAFTKQGFWLNQSYLKEVVKKH